MREVECEECNGNLRYELGVFECEECGAEYTVSELVKIDNDVKKLICKDCKGEYHYGLNGIPVCENGCNHPDDSFRYMCSSEWCRCKQ